MLIIVFIYLLVAVCNSMCAGILYCSERPDTCKSDVHNINWWIAVVLYGLLWPGVWILNGVDMFKKDT